jgi:hypothetical protein
MIGRSGQAGGKHSTATLRSSLSIRTTVHSVENELAAAAYHPPHSSGHTSQGGACLLLLTNTSVVLNANANANANQIVAWWLTPLKP